MAIELGKQYDEELHFAAHRAARRLAQPWSPADAALDFGTSALAHAYLDLVARRGLGPTLICVPSIQLASGQYFNFLEPDSTPVSMADIANALSKINRFNGHNTDSHGYSVAQHCVVGSRHIAPAFAFEFLMHDAPESVIGDVTTPLKQLCPDYKGIEHGVERSFANQYLLPREMSPEVKECDTRMAATEKRDLMPPDMPGSEWEFLRNVAPYDEKINIWTADYAALKFQERFNELWPAHITDMMPSIPTVRSHFNDTKSE